MASILDMINRQRDVDYNLQLAKAQEDRELERQLEAEQRRLENQMKLYEARTGRTSQPTATEETEETPTVPPTFYDIFSERLSLGCRLNCLVGRFFYRFFL